MNTPARDLDDYQRQYRALPFEPTQARYRRRCVLARIAARRPLRLLEVGCGEAPLFTDLPGMHVTVVEPAASFAANALQLAQGRTNVRVVECTLEAADTSIGPFDMVVVSCLLHELDDPQALLAAARRLCSPESVLHVNVPNAQSLHRLLAVAMGLIPSAKAISATQLTMQQHTTYDRVTLTAELASAGFDVIEEGSLFVKPFSHAQMQRLLDEGFMTSAMLDGLDALVATLPSLGSEIWADAKVGRG
ncbi:MAG: class I SAM-dependent methyltransferase [Rhizobacter sp.]|nr:class I SAM-dependent methyltransferase [Rhizobacter sp.]